MTAPHICSMSLRSEEPLTEDRFFAALQAFCAHILIAHGSLSGPKGQFVVMCQPDDVPAVEGYIASYIRAAWLIADQMGLTGSIFEPEATDIALIDMPPKPGMLLTISIKLPDQQGA